METLLSVLPWIQIILAVILTVAILLQQRGAGIGGAFGGNDGGIHYERRGSERTLFKATILLAVLFVFATFIQILLTQSTTPDYIPQNDVMIETELLSPEELAEEMSAADADETIPTGDVSSPVLENLIQASDASQE